MTRNHYLYAPRKRWYERKLQVPVSLLAAICLVATVFFTIGIHRDNLVLVEGSYEQR